MKRAEVRRRSTRRSCEGGRLETTALKVSFLAVDSTGEHETGDAREETNPITLKYDYAYRDGARRVTLKAVPLGTIRYTLDGSNPRNGGVCDAGEVLVPDGRDRAPRDRRSTGNLVGAASRGRSERRCRR